MRTIVFRFCIGKVTGFTTKLLYAVAYVTGVLLGFSGSLDGSGVHVDSPNHDSKVLAYWSLKLKVKIGKLSASFICTFHFSLYTLNCTLFGPVVDT